jgi:hypothetical protein
MTWLVLGLFISLLLFLALKTSFLVLCDQIITFLLFHS